MDKLDDKTQKLLESCKKLVALLEDPHPGLFRWCNLTASRCKEVHGIIDDLGFGKGFEPR